MNPNPSRIINDLKLFLGRVATTLAVALLAIAFLTPCSNASEARPLRDILSFSGFSSLIQFNLRRVPDFRELWHDPIQFPHDRQIYWGGGTLRGFLHWHFLQLQTHSIEEVKQMPIPAIAELMPLGGKDVDLFGPINLAQEIIVRMEKTGHIDFIDAADLQELVKLGGASLEKMAVNPWGILDPLSGFRHYYEGRIVFEWSDENQFKDSRLNINDYSKTGEALRFIRFAHFNLPELTPDAQSVKSIQRIANAEALFIQTEDRLAWIEICLEKLYAAASGNLGRMLSLLHHYNLLQILGDAGVQVPEELFADVRNWVSRNKNELTAQESTSLDKVVPLTMSSRCSFLLRSIGDKLTLPWNKRR